MTFDKKFYEFSGECSYLLARDFIDGYFSVVANYQSQSGEVSKKSMTVFCKDKQVEVFPDGQVMLEGRSTDLPLEVEGTIIKRVASMIFINNPNGINIDCDLVHDRCTVAVSGWYFGKTGGLLGTYDNEPITDLMKPDNTLASTVEEMAESWIVGSRCRATNYAKVTREDEYSPKYQACAKYFTETTSPFRPCFRQVDPEPFMTMCLNDEDSCDAASYYVYECKKNSVTIRQPRECGTCWLLLAVTLYTYCKSSMKFIKSLAAIARKARISCNAYCNIGFKHPSFTVVIWMLLINPIRCYNEYTVPRPIQYLSSTTLLPVYLQ